MGAYVILIVIVLCLVAAITRVSRVRSAFFTLLDRVGSATLGIVELLYRRQLNTAYGLLICGAVGLFAAATALMHGGYFAAAADNHDEPAAEASGPREPSPGVMPPLEYQINVADCILLAETRVENSLVSFEPQDVWKAPEDCARGGSATLAPDISLFELQGYRPRQGQLAVLFFTPGRDRVPQLIELLPVNKGRLVYAPDDPSATRELELNDLRQLVSHPTDR